MSVSTVQTQSNETYCLVLTSESTYNIPKFGSRGTVTLKNASLADMTLSCIESDTVDGATSLTIKGYSSITLMRGATEWVAMGSYDKRDEASDNLEVYGTLTVDETSDFIGDANFQGDITQDEGEARLTRLVHATTLDTTTAVGAAFTNQPANDGIDIVSDNAGDTTQTVTIIGTTQGTDTVVVETVTLTGTTIAPTVKVDWGVVLALKKSAATLGTVTVSETSGSATISAGLTAAVLSLGVKAVSAADQEAYNRVLILVSDGATTKHIGLKGTNTSDVVIYDSQALAGTAVVNSNTAMRAVTEIYTGDLEVTRTATATNTTDIALNGAKIGYNLTAYATGTAYTLTDTAAAIDVGTTDPAIVLDKAGTYLIFGQVHMAYAGATVVGETASIKVRRTNNTAADLSSVVVIDLPVSTTLTHSYGVVQIPPFVYTTTAADDAVTLFGNVSATLGAGTINVTAIGTSIVALRTY